MWNWKQTVISDSEASPSAGVSLSVWSPQIVLRSYPDIQYSSCSLTPYLIDNSYIIRRSQKATAAAAPGCFADTERQLSSPSGRKRCVASKLQLLHSDGGKAAFLFLAWWMYVSEGGWFMGFIYLIAHLRYRSMQNTQTHLHLHEHTYTVCKI